MAKQKASDKGASARVNKSAEIRSYLEEKQDAGPTEIVEALAAKGVHVTAGFVSNIKSKSKFRTKGRRGRKPRAAAVASASAEVADVNALLGAKRLADQLGGIEQAQDALNVLKRLQ